MAIMDQNVDTNAIAAIQPKCVQKRQENACLAAKRAILVQAAKFVSNSLCYHYVIILVLHHMCIMYYHKAVAVISVFSV